MNSTTPPPAITDGDVAVGYVLIPFLLITVVGVVAAIDRLRHQLLPVYTYDPSEEINEAEQEILWREEDTRVVRGWAGSYQQRRPLLTKDINV
uniref:Uncharacterized protein n=1 Tax=Mola mola TaxID=94237 RepID=A0A3Q3X0K4_MOLML